MVALNGQRKPGDREYPPLAETSEEDLPKNMAKMFMAARKKDGKVRMIIYRISKLESYLMIRSIMGRLWANSSPPWPVISESARTGLTSTFGLTRGTTSSSASCPLGRPPPPRKESHLG